MELSPINLNILNNRVVNMNTYLELAELSLSSDIFLWVLGTLPPFISTNSFSKVVMRLMSPEPGSSLICVKVELPPAGGAVKVELS